MITTNGPAVPTTDGLYWLTSVQLAELACISERVGRKALLRATVGHTWNGATLVVRKQGRAYEVDARSLPEHLYRKFWETNRDRLTTPQVSPPENDLQPERVCRGRELLAKHYKEAEWKAKIIGPALQFRRNSRGRGEMLRHLAEQTYIRPSDGKPIQFAESKLRGFCQRFEEGGVHALMRKERRTEAAHRRLVNRKWEQACPLPLPEKTRLAEEIERYIRGLWAAGAPSRYKVRQMASAELAVRCRAAGWVEADIRNCDVGQYLVEYNQDARLVAMNDRDAKRFSDLQKPRIARDRSEFAPGEAIVADVHPVDILLQREDGSTYTPRMIAWYDLATNRCFYTLKHCAPGESVKQGDVTKSFVEMCMEWGIPRVLYLDNGPEYSWDAMVQGFHVLAGMGVELDARLGAIAALEARWEHEGVDGICVDAPAVETRVEEDSDRRSIIRARPYNAAAKPVEGAFSAKEKVLSMLPGYIGGDRMNKRVSKVGRAAETYPGSAEAFDLAFAEAMAFFHTTPQRGHLRGMSPEQCYAVKRAEARVTRVTRADLIVFVKAFSEERTLKVGTQGVRVGSGEGDRWYYGDELIPLINTKQRFLFAKWRPEAILLVRPLAGGKEKYVPIHERPVYGFFDPEGAKEQSRRDGIARRNVRSLRATADQVDLRDAMRTTVVEARSAFGSDPEASAVEHHDRLITLTPELQVANDALSNSIPKAPERLGPGEFVDRDGSIRRLPTRGEIQKRERQESGFPPLPAGIKKPASTSQEPFDFEEHGRRIRAEMKRTGKVGQLE